MREKNYTATAREASVSSAFVFIPLDSSQQLAARATSSQNPSRNVLIQITSSSMPHLSDPDIVSSSATARLPPTRKQSQHSTIAKTAIMNVATPSVDGLQAMELSGSNLGNLQRSATGRNGSEYKPGFLGVASRGTSRDGVGHALSDTPATTAPNSPKM